MKLSRWSALCGALLLTGLLSCGESTSSAVTVPARSASPEPEVELHHAHGAALSAAMSQAVAGANPETCEGYPEPRIFLESQGWWDATGIEFPAKVGEHIHVGTCWPVAADGSSAIITGPVTLDVRLMVHNSTGSTNWLRGGLTGIGDWGGFQRTLVIPPSKDTTVWQVVTLDPISGNAPIGRSEFRISLNIPRNSTGDRQFQSTGWQICYKACSPTYRSGHSTIARGWYDDGHDYANSGFASALPIKPVSGLWTFTPSLVATGIGGVFVDPDFHNGKQGLRIGPTQGPFKGPVTLDTRLLPDGRHKLAIISSDNQNAGVLVVSFVVANGTTPPPPPPPPADVTAPVLSGIAPSGVLPAGTRSTTVSLQTNEVASCRLALTDEAYTSMPLQMAGAGSTAHSLVVSGLNDGGQYAYFARCVDAAGNANGSSVSVSFSVAVVPVGSVAVTTGVRVGQSVQLVAALKDANGNILSNRVLTWSSSAGTIATVNEAGVVTGVAAGSATVTASSEGKSSTIVITVVAN